jgi:protein ImuA
MTLLPKFHGEARLGPVQDPGNDPLVGHNPININALKESIAHLERSAPFGDPTRSRSSARHSPWGKHKDQGVILGLPTMDTHLPWKSLPRGALHEFAGAGADREQAAASAGFAALWLARLQKVGPVLWVAHAAGLKAVDLHAHGLRRFGLDPRRLIVVAARRDEEILWAMEEGLKARGLSAVLGEIGKLDLTASRRLQLAAEAGGVAAFVLRRWCLMAAAEREAAQPIAALTRWRVAGLKGGNGGIHWRVDLARCRGGRPGSWILTEEEADGANTIHAAPLSGDLAEALAGRSLAPRASARRAAG